MKDTFTLGVTAGLLAGLINGIFILPMRFTREWAWENVWLIFTICSTAVFPWVAALIAVPQIFVLLSRTSPSQLSVALIAGFVWGIAQVLYGLGCGMVGIAIGSALIACTAITSGTLGPALVYAPEQLFGPSSLPLLLAVALIVAGVYQYSTAQSQREKESGSQVRQLQIIKGSSRVGLIVCLTSGVLGTAFIYGEKSSSSLLSTSVALGVPSSVSYIAIYLVVFNAGAVPGILYTLFKLFRNKTFVNYMRAFTMRNCACAVAMAICWYGAILLYGMSSERMGRLGPSIAFALFSGGTVLFSNLFGWMAGEWRGSSRRTIKGFVKGMAFIVAAILIVAFGTHLSK